jgi:CBS domain-containing protein
MQVFEIMDEFPVCVFGSDPVTKAAEIMREHDCGIVPVIERGSGGIVVGVVTDRDICLRVVGRAKDCRTTTVVEAMTANPVCCGPRDDVRYVLLLMREHQLRRILVIDSERLIAGIVCISNLVDNVSNHEDLMDMLRGVSNAALTHRMELARVAGT